MDENSSKGETSESANKCDGEEKSKVESSFEKKKVLDSVTVDLMRVNSVNKFYGQRQPSFDESGPSTQSSQPKTSERKSTDLLVELAEAKNSSNVCIRAPALMSNCQIQECQPQVQMALQLEQFQQEQAECERSVVGPPPSYSFVMKLKKKVNKQSSIESVNVANRPPPPTYSGSRGVYVTSEEAHRERICNFPSFSEPMWRSHSQPALCSRCGVLVLTTTHTHDTLATHVAALVLCLFGCWPCCLLPYCMNVCKNTYHHCPICQSFLGAYTPW